MRIVRHGGTALADQKIQVCAQMRLLHMFDVQLLVTPRGCGWGDPVFAPFGQLGIAHLQVQPAPGHVEFNHVAVLHQGQRATGSRLG